MSDPKPEQKQTAQSAGTTPDLQTFYCQVRDRNDPSKINQLTLQLPDLQEAVAHLQSEGYLVISIQTSSEGSAKSIGLPWVKKASQTSPFGTGISADGTQSKTGTGGKSTAPVATSGQAAVPQPFLAHVSTGDLVSFAVQLSALLRAGIPLLQSLRVVTKGVPQKYFRAVLQDIIDQVNQGFTFHHALTTHPKIFPMLWCNLVEVGEVSGNLADVLEEISHYQESSEKMKGKVLTAFFYPGVLTVLATGAVIFLLLSIIPKFDEIFKSMKMELPAITQMVITASNILRQYSILVALAIGLIIFLFTLVLKNKTGKLILDTIVLKIPIIGTLIMQVSVVRMCRSLGTLLKSGVPILQSLKISAKLTENSVIRDTLLNAYESVEAGHGLGSVLEASKTFPVFVTQLINVGEESGELIRFFSLIADYYEAKVDAFVSRLSTMLEPLMLVLVGSVIGVIVVSMFLPLAEISTRGA